MKLSNTKLINSPGNSPKGATAPVRVEQEPVGPRAKRISLIHEEAYLCTT